MFIMKEFFIALFLFLLLVSCQTDDILPYLKFESSSESMNEDSGSVSLTATLNSHVDEELKIPLIFGGTAEYGVDYTSNSKSITLGSDLISHSIEISSSQDLVQEGVESIIVSVGENDKIISLSRIEISILDDDIDSDNDGVFDAFDYCPNEPGEIDNDGCPWLGLIINEVNYDPASGNAGDANGDGSRSPHDDEFIELYYSGPDEIDLSGYTIEDGDHLRHTFSSQTILQSKKAIVIFGGGSPTGDFGGSMVQTANGFEERLNMNNAGDEVTIKDSNGQEVLVFDITPLSNNPDESYTRNPDLTGDFEQHSTIEQSGGRLFSPGTKIDGTSF